MANIVILFANKLVYFKGYDIDIVIQIVSRIQHNVIGPRPTIYMYRLKETDV